jgi:hypothetical protein
VVGVPIRLDLIQGQMKHQWFAVPLASAIDSANELVR